MTVRTHTTLALRRADHPRALTFEQSNEPHGTSRNGAPHGSSTEGRV